MRLRSASRPAPLPPETDPASQPPAPAERRLPWLLLLFVGSGCAALVYEIVWFQMLELVIGSSALSLGVLLGTYMGGMCLGSLLLPRLVSRKRHPLRVYAFLELGIGLCGLLLLGLLPASSAFYAQFLGQGGLLVRGAFCAVLLLPPTVMMGATLPAISRWVEGSPRGMSWLGFFYGGNIAGAVFGCLLAGFYLLRLFDVTVASLTAVALNAAVGLLALALAAGSRPSPAAEPEPEPEPSGAAASGSGAVYLAIGLSGLTALGSEVLWTRLLSLLLGGTVYTFSLILAVFLTGLGLGSACGSWLARRSHARTWLGISQMLAAAGIAWAAALLTRSLPFWPINSTLNPDPWILFQIDLLRCAFAVLPAAFLWGASFPLALAAVAEREADCGALVGRVYAANTLGAIVGAVGTSVLLVSWLGTQHAHQLLIGLAVLSGLVLLAPIVFPEKPKTLAEPSAALGLIAALAVGLALLVTVAPVPWQLVAYGREVATNLGYSTPIFVGEGMNSSVAVTRWTTGERCFHVSGKVEASTVPQDMRLQRLLGHLPALVHPEPRSVLIVGCGAGVTAGSFVLHPSIRRIVICEMEPLVPRVVAEHFGEENYHVVRDPRVQIVYDDARHYILTTREKFDIITSDPINPWMKGAATLYTQDYFELVRKRLNPGGVVTQWVPLYEATPEAVKSEMATFFRVFPGGSVWSNDAAGKGYDVVMLGQAEPQRIDVDRLQARLESPPFARVKTSLTDVRLGDAATLVRTYAGRAADLGNWLAGAEINRDRNLRLQYLAGLGANIHQEDPIYQDMLRYRRFPKGLLTGSEARLRPLRAVLGPPLTPAQLEEEDDWLLY